MISKEEVRTKYRDYINSLENALDEDRAYIINRALYRDVIRKEANNLNVALDEETVEMIINILDDEGYVD